MHNVLTLIARCDETDDIKTLARISDEVTGEFTQVSIIEYCLTELQAASDQSLVGNEIVFAKQKYKIIDNLDFGVYARQDLYSITKDLVDLIKGGYLNGKQKEVESVFDFLQKIEDAIDNEGECSLELHSLLLEEIK